MEEKDNMQLPENAFRELKDGEEYKPLMSSLRKAFSFSPFLQPGTLNAG